jgi:hypothetical protein
MPEARMCLNIERDKAGSISHDMFYEPTRDGRSNVRILLRNNTTETLRYTDSQLEGRWFYEPPNTIPPDMQAGFNATGSSIFRGTEGWISYQIGYSGETLVIRFDAPYERDHTNRLVINNERRFHYETKGGNEKMSTYVITIGKLCHTVKAAPSLSLTKPESGNRCHDVD